MSTIRKILPFVLLAFLLANCTKYNLSDIELTNKEEMNLLDIPDPLVWNSLTTQFLEIDTTSGGMKASNGISKLKEYPNKGYYFTLFEDLFPAQGDYDFNDVVLRTKLFLDGKKKEVWGNIETYIYHRGGTLPTQLGLLIFSVKGNKEYTRIENDQIVINGVRLSGDDPYIIDLPAEGSDINIEYFIDDPTSNINQIWFSWFIVTDTNGEKTEIHSSGFPVASNKKFDIPKRDFLTTNNLPWGLEIEAEEFFIPTETTLFLQAFPEFKDWAESAGIKNKDWYKNPDMDYIQ